MFRLSRYVTAMGLMLLATGPAWGQPSDPQQSLDISKIVQIVGGISVTPPAQAASLPKFADVTKGMVSKKGMMILWYYPADAPDKDHEKLLCQIPSSLLGQQFMLSTSIAGGGFFTDFPLDERVVLWELRDRQVILTEPQTRYVIDRSKEVGDVVRRTYPDRIRAAVPLLTKAPNGDPVIDLGPLLKSNFADISWTAWFGGGGGGQINASLSKWTEKKAFELNVEIGVELALRRFSPPGSYDKRLVHYSFWMLPKTDYRPRIADDRVGYFLTVNEDWGKPTNARDLFNRYIDRWHLVKRDPSLKLCEPRRPIVFYIEKTVPVRFRRAVRDGILEWNKAFEKIGFVNAIEVRQQTDDNEWKDLDPEDMRYSFFRWIVTGAGFAMGPHRANPFTGQIYDADIVFDDSMVRFYEQDAEMFLPQTAIEWKFADPGLRGFVETFPFLRPQVPDYQTLAVGVSEPQMPSRAEAFRRLRRRGHHACDYMDRMKHEMILARTALAGQPKEVIDRFLYEVVKEVVTHEVGHTLGLRHNFKASTIFPLDEICKRRTTDQPTTGSVMDYNPLLLFAKDTAKGHFVSPTIGPYDYWAIEYGYRPFDGSAPTAGQEKKADKHEQKEEKAAQPSATAEKTPATPPSAGEQTLDLNKLPKEVLAQMPPEVKAMIASGQVKISMSAGAAAALPATKAGPVATPKFASAPSGEKEMLQQIASRSTRPELAYATDEDATWLSPDPRAARFDMGSDPIDWARTRIELVNARMKDILKWSVKDKESWYHARRAFTRLLFEKVFVLDYVGRYIGGEYFSRAHRGDPDAPPPFVLVDAQRQRAALDFIAKTLYSDEFFAVSPDVLNHLAPSRWWHVGSRVSFSMDFPIHRYIALFQWWNLFDRLHPPTLRRIHDAELKTTAADKLTAAEYVRRIRDACWKDAVDTGRLRSGKWSDAHPFVSDVRRSLQREYLGLVEPLVRSRPGMLLPPDLHAMMRYSLVELSDQLKKVIDAGGVDFASRAHLVECKSRIDRMLSPQLREYEPYWFMGAMYLQPAARPQGNWPAARPRGN